MICQKLKSSVNKKGLDRSQSLLSKIYRRELLAEHVGNAAHDFDLLTFSTIDKHSGSHQII